MSGPTVTAIRAPTPDIANHQAVLTQLKEETELGRRIRGDANNSFVTLGELISAGIVKYIDKVVSPASKASGGGLSTVSVLDSITGNGSVGSPLKLVGDVSSPGANQMYGTNGSGVRGWYAVSGGGGSSQPFNVTPDTHDVAPTGVGVGPNDEFEYGSTLDTTGARYASATPWTKALTNTETYAINSGSLLVTDTGQSDILITQPISGAAWRVRSKLNFYGSGGGSVATHLEVMARDSSTGKACGGGLIINPSFVPYVWQPYWSNDATFNNYVNLNGPLTSYPSIWDTGYSKFSPVYIELELISASVIFRISDTGFNGSFVTQGTLALSTNSQTVVDTIAIRMHTNAGLNAAIDWFRRVA